MSDEAEFCPEVRMKYEIHILSTALTLLVVASCKSGSESEVKDNRTLKPVSFANGQVIGESDGNPDGGDGPGINTNPGTQNTAACANATDLPDVAAGSGQVLLNLASTTIDPCSVSGYVVGQQGSFNLVPTKTGRYFVDGLVQGTYDIVITASSLGLLNASQGARINDIRVENGSRVDRPSVAIGALGSITGKVELADAADGTVEGTRVYIPGTSYEAIANASGAFEMTGVVPGTHDLRYEKLNYRPSVQGAVAVPNGGNVIAGTVEMLIQNGEVTPLYIPGGELTFRTREIEFFLFPNGTPELMRVSDTPLFANQVFGPFKTNGTFIFPVDEQLRNGGAATKTLYIEIQDDAVTERLSAPIRIDFFGDIRQRADVVTPAAATVKGTLDIGVTILRPASATAYRTSTKEGVFGDWISIVGEGPTVSTTVRALGQGPATVFVQYMTEEGILSPLYTADVNVVIFPNAVSFNIPTPVIDAVYNPMFRITDITHPLPPSEGRVLVSLSESFQDPVELDGEAKTFDVLVPDTCGEHRIFLKVIHLPTGTESAPVSQTVNYRCVLNLKAQGLNGNKLPLRSGGLLYRDRYYHFSGHDDSNRDTSQGYYFDFRTERWNLMSEIGAPAPREYGQMFGYNGKLVFFDGSKGTGTDNKVPDGGIYDPKTDTWERIVPINEAIPGIPAAFGNTNSHNYSKQRSFHIGDTLHFFFAHHYESKDFGHYVYDLTDKKWSIPDTLAISPSNNLDSHMVQGGPYVFMFGGSPNGGDDEDGVAKMRDSWFYDSRSNLWNKMNDKDKPGFRSFPVMTWTGEEFFVWGGLVFDEEKDDQVNRNDGGLFNPETNTWKKIANAPSVGRDTEKYKTMVEVYDGKVFIFGGASRDTDNVVWFGLIYDIAADSWKPMSNVNIPKRGLDFVHSRMGNEVYLYVQDDKDFLPENNIKIYNLATDTWRDSVVDSTNLEAENTEGRVFSVSQAVPGRYLHFGRRVQDPNGGYTHARDGFMSFEQKSPLVLVDFKVDGNSKQQVRKGSAHNIDVVYRNRQVAVEGVTAKLALVSGPAVLLTDSISNADFSANADTTVQGLQIQINEDAQTGDVIRLMVSYENAEYWGTEFIELSVLGSAGPQALIAEQPDAPAVLGQQVTISIPFVNRTNTDFDSSPEVTVGAIHCLTDVSLVDGFEDNWVVGASQRIEVLGTIPSTGCDHGERATFELQLASNGEVLTRVRSNIVLGLKTYRISEEFDPEDPSAGYVKFNGDLDDDSGANQLLSYSLTVGSGELLYDFGGEMRSLQTGNNRNKINISTDANLGDDFNLEPIIDVIAGESRLPADQRVLSPEEVEYEYDLFGLISARTYKEFGSLNDGIEEWSGVESESNLHIYNDLIGREGAGTWTIIPTPTKFSQSFLEMKFSKFEFYIQTLVPEP